jgi:putative sigma-54 modulation protein
MELQLTGKHMDIDAADREFAQKLADKLAADYGKLTSLRMVVASERGKMVAEAHLTGKHVNLNAGCTADKVGVALQGCVDKLDKQMRRYLERVQDRSVAADPQLKEKIWNRADLELA